MSTKPATTAERQAALRERRAAEGLSEVRGIYARTSDHVLIKEFATVIAARYRSSLAKSDSK